MLIEIMCEEFKDHGRPRGRISLHPGLNTVLGSDEGSNSIGKSTFLMIIDFVFGGNDYVNKLHDVQREVGEHDICFAFRFHDRIHYFSRSSRHPGYIQKCDADYRPLLEAPISQEEYLSELETMYDMNLQELSFRNAIGRSMRINNRETLAVKRPLHQATQQKAEEAIKGLLKLTGAYAGIASEAKTTQSAEERYKAFLDAQKFNYIPTARNQSEYDENLVRIAKHTREINELADKSFLSLLDLNSAQAEQLAVLRGKLSNLKRQRTLLRGHLQAIKTDQELNKKGLTSQYVMLDRFFPGTNLRLIADTEKFHAQLSKILGKEFSENERQLMERLEPIENEIAQIETKISLISGTPDLSKLILVPYAGIKKKLETLSSANDNFIKLDELKKTAEAAKKALDRLVKAQTSTTMQKINDKMAELNDKIYDGTKTAPRLEINGLSSYKFFTPRDGGTGTQSRGLIVFDLALLALTVLPVVAHDSPLLKQIEDDAIEKILELYANVAPSKQIFIAIDKKGSYTEKAQRIIEDTKVLQLGPGEGALFGRTWNDKSPEA